MCEGGDLQYRRKPGAFHTSIANGIYNELGMHCFFASFAGGVLIDFTILRSPGELPDKGRHRPPPEIASFFGQEFCGQPFLEREFLGQRRLRSPEAGGGMTSIRNTSEAPRDLPYVPDGNVTQPQQMGIVGPCKPRRPSVALDVAMTATIRTSATAGCAGPRCAMQHERGLRRRWHAQPLH